MSSRFPVPKFRARAAWAALGLLLLGGALIGAGRAPSRAPEFCTPSGTMSDADMAALGAAHYAAHPAHGNATTAAAVDTFIAANGHFNADHNVATVIDTVHITAGQGVMFKWGTTQHTVTSGNENDADAGSLFDYPLDSTHQEVTIAFTNPGTYPFFCWYHYWFPMRGVVIVDPDATPTRPSTWGGLKAHWR